MSTPFEILDHTADIGFRAWGATAAELFQNAALATMSIAAETSAIATKTEWTIEVDAEGYESLLVNWLSEILYLFDSDRFAPNMFRVDEASPTRLRGVLLGEPRDPRRHPWVLIVKAVTYHEIKVEQRDGLWEARVFLDI